MGELRHANPESEGKACGKDSGSFRAWQAWRVKLRHASALTDPGAELPRLRMRA